MGVILILVTTQAARRRQSSPRLIRSPGASHAVTREHFIHLMAHAEAPAQTRRERVSFELAGFRIQNEPGHLAQFIPTTVQVEGAAAEVNKKKRTDPYRARQENLSSC